MSVDLPGVTGTSQPIGCGSNTHPKTSIANKTTDKVAEVGDRSLTPEDREYLIIKLMNTRKFSRKDAEEEVDSF